MLEADPARYGQMWAAVYDEVHGFLDPSEAVELLHELAAGGPALELGIGTGRVAIPLAARGIAVHGIDASEAMVQQLRAKVGGAAIPVTLGDFTEVAVDGSYALVYVVFSTIFGLPTQDAQVACFRNVAARLNPAGVFVVEAFVPDVARFDRQQRVHVQRVEPGRVDVSLSRHDPVAQRILSQHVTLTDGGVRLLPVEVRYAWPGELDLMARLAGLRLRERHGDWQRGAFTAASPIHVSVYERA
ncbi:MAG TPA: class I SAM-dependent methyltransferase [Kofleriaceae bacterium]|jgi:SAM-dependent methyltransferase